MRSILPFFVITTSLIAQVSNAPADTLILSDGERLIGHLKRATASSLIFTSDMLGEITVDWKKVQELHTSSTYAVIPKQIKVRGPENAAQVPQGPITATAQQVQVSRPAPAPPESIPVENVSAVVAAPDFERALHRYGILHGWRGTATGGVSLIEATQKDRTATAAVNLVRAIPPDNWTEQRYRTLFNLNEAYGKLRQPGTPAVKTSLFHLDLEHDMFLSPRLFAFGGAAFDHSFSQGLDLQQTYGGGLGYVLLKSASQELDVKGSANYIRQQFAASQEQENLIGSVFSETYIRTLFRGISLNEQASITPAWNEPNAYSAFARAALTFPVYHRFGFTLNAVDNFLNNPPPGFKKNSLQISVGATYSFQ